MKITRVNVMATLSKFKPHRDYSHISMIKKQGTIMLIQEYIKGGVWHFFHFLFKNKSKDKFSQLQSWFISLNSIKMV
jgi:hypothetical protein